MTITSGISPAHIRVHDAMHVGIVTCDAETSLRGVARLMAEHRVHAVAVADPGRRGRHQGVISDLEVAAAIATGTERTAAESTTTEWSRCPRTTVLTTRPSSWSSTTSPI